MKRKYRIALCGYYGFGNLGDELLALALRRASEREGVSPGEMVVLSATPSETYATLGIRAVQRWNAGAVFQVLRHSETLLLGGGGLFQDSTSRRSCLYYWGLVKLALAAGSLPWCVGQSIGPFRSKICSALARSAMGSCSQRGVRDVRSRALLEEWGMQGRLMPDPVFSLASSMRPGRKVPSPGGGELLVNIRPWKEGLPVRTASEAARIAGKLGLSITGVALSEEDGALMAELRDRGEFPCVRVVRLCGGRWMDEASALFAHASGAVAMRYHFALLSILHGVPLSVAAYDPKVEALASEWDIPCWKGEESLPEPRGLDASRAKDRLREMDSAFSTEFSEMWDAVQKRKGRSAP